MPTATKQQVIQPFNSRKALESYNRLLCFLVTSPGEPRWKQDRKWYRGGEVSRASGLRVCLCVWGKRGWVPSCAALRCDLFLWANQGGDFCLSVPQDHSLVVSEAANASTSLLSFGTPTYDTLPGLFTLCGHTRGFSHIVHFLWHTHPLQGKQKSSSEFIPCRGPLQPCVLCFKLGCVSPDLVSVHNDSPSLVLGICSCLFIHLFIFIFLNRCGEGAECEGCMHMQFIHIMCGSGSDTVPGSYLCFQRGL